MAIYMPVLVQCDGTVSVTGRITECPDKRYTSARVQIDRHNDTVNLDKLPPDWVAMFHSVYGDLQMCPNCSKRSESCTTTDPSSR